MDDHSFNPVWISLDWNQYVGKRFQGRKYLPSLILLVPGVRSLYDWQLSIKISSKFLKAVSFLWVMGPFLKFQSQQQWDKPLPQYPLSPFVMLPLWSTPLSSSSVFFSPLEGKCTEDEMNHSVRTAQGQLTQPSPLSSSRLFPLLHTQASPYRSHPLSPLPITSGSMDLPSPGTSYKYTIWPMCLPLFTWLDVLEVVHLDRTTSWCLNPS